MKTILSFKSALLPLLVSGALITACSSSVEQNERNESEAGEANTDPLVLVAEPRLVDNNLRVELQAALAGSASNTNPASMEIAVAGDAAIAVRASRIRVFQSDYDIYRPRENRENYGEFENSSVLRVANNPVSTFSIDVDTGAYSNVRRILNTGNLPPVDAVRAEELINYFSYDYPRPNDQTTPFSIYTEMSVSPWNRNKHLLHIGLKAVDLLAEEQLPANLVFLVDVSGSMQSANKLELLKTSLKMLSRQMDAEDTVSIVVYAGASGVVLEPTAANESRKISAALERLTAGGSTNGAAGIQLAYSLAQDAFIEGGINRVILATDGDFNVGVVDFDELKELISRKRESGISLTTLGFGTGNYNDHLMEQLADAGNGNYAYIDTINEARKVLVDELASTLQTVAKDVKIQIEFNPSVVSEYRLIGYENRALAREDFNNDKVDAGEIGAGHTVTVIYEISLVGSNSLSVDPLRYGTSEEAQIQAFTEDTELAYLKLRYKAPGGDNSQLVALPIMVADINEELDSTSANFRFSAAVAGMAQLLRANNQLDDFDYEDVIALANGAKGQDVFGYRSEFINLVRTAQTLSIR